ncbi:MAG: PTS sugar transporter subunit IIA [Myxococcaceae bacterium]|nr:PTS sugar transporter subunit IIA [Myxococcaceae bacterium]
MKIAEFLKPEAVIFELSSSSKRDVLHELSQSLARANPALGAGRFAEVLLEREKQASTGIAEGLAIPHGRLAGLPTLMACFGVSRPGIDFEAADGKRTHLFFALVAPENAAGLHLRALSRIVRLFKSAQFRDAILQATSQESIYALIAQEDAKA